ncbi:MAG: hypothetical protein DME55_07705 [Verrucomicrobia bacterium]|nr:MAG: hypothetical protein DME55_07705 [Verrucomicrobiota bacterium]
MYWQRKRSGGALLSALLLLPATVYFHNIENDRTILERWCKEAGVTAEEVTQSGYGDSEEGLCKLDIWKVAVQKRYPSLDNFDRVEEIADKWMIAYDQKHIH